MSGLGQIFRTFVQNWPANMQVQVSNFPNTWVIGDGGGSITVDGQVNIGNFPTTQQVSGSVSISNLPAVQQVGDNGASLTVDTPQLPATLGQKTAANSLPVVLASDQPLWPTTQPISGTVAATQSGTWNVAIAAGTNLIGAVTSRGTNTIVTGQVQMAAGNTRYLLAAARANRRSISFVPTSQFTYFYGDAALTQTNGMVAPNGLRVTLETTAAIYVISGSTGVMTFEEHF